MQLLSPFFCITVTVSLTADHYNVTEGDGTVSVCAVIRFDGNAPPGLVRQISLGLFDRSAGLYI